VRTACDPVIIADAKELKRQARILGLLSDYPVVPVVEATEIRSFRTTPMICDVGPVTEGINWGQISAAGGRSASHFVETAVKLCLDGHVDAIATAPLNKEAIQLAGSQYSGHTDMLAGLCGSASSLMCFFARELRVALLTIHTSLAEAIKSITREHVTSTLLVLDRELRRFGLAEARIAVCGLNPHAGEHGLFGHEEQTDIGPAIEDCRSRGIRCSGPFPADTIFVRAARGEFDAVLACYHDQGLIAVKCLFFGQAVNVTLGLPIIRTSVDHGTAFDIAGEGAADHLSMVEAVTLAARLVQEERITRIAESG
jgi:4-phospho-D-threonate 3-dehydrogenase / 4-phospho-D-erythronate 3-dehydrogenase